MAEQVINSVSELPGYRVLMADAFMLNNAGSYITQELGFALAWGNEWLSVLTDKGLSVDKVANRIKFNFGISSNYFMEIPRRSHAMGPNRFGLQTELRLCIKNRDACTDFAVQHDHIRCTRQFTSFPNRNHVGSIGRSQFHHCNPI